MRSEAGRTAAAFEEAVRAVGLRSFEPRVSPMRTEDALELNARYADLVLVGKPDPSNPSCTLGHDGLSMLLQRIGRPVLAVPTSTVERSVGRRPLVAWSATREARRAVDDAMPILKKAERVDVLVVNARPGRDGHGDLPGADLALLLARQGVEVEARDESTTIDVGSALLSRAADLGSDLIVMGAYGHAYLREWLFGGVTDTMLRSTPVPVLMSH